MVKYGHGHKTRARAQNSRMIEMYEEKTRGNIRTWGFIHLTERLRMHVSCLVRTQTFTPEYTQSFIHLAPGVYSASCTPGYRITPYKMV